VRNKKSYKQPVVIREQATLDLPDFTNLTNSYKFKNGGVKQYNLGGADENEGTGTDPTSIDQQWADFLDNNPDYVMGGGGKFVLGASGQWIKNPTFVRDIPIRIDPDTGKQIDYDIDAYIAEQDETLQNQLKEINSHDAFWRSEQRRMLAASKGHPTSPGWNPGLRVGPYQVTQGMEQDRLNSMPTFHPQYDAGKTESYNQYYSDLLDKKDKQQAIGRKSMAESSTFASNLIKSIIDPFWNAPARLVTYGLNEAFGDGTQTVDWRSPMFRNNSYDEHGNMIDKNPSTAQVIPGYENRNSFANFLLNAASDPLSFLGGRGVYKNLPKAFQTTIKNAPRTLTTKTYNLGKNTLKSNKDGFVKGTNQILNRQQAKGSYFNPWSRTAAGLGNTAYYGAKTSAVPSAFISTADFINRGMFSKDGVTGDDALNTTFDVLDAGMPFSSSIRDMWKGSVRDYQSGSLLSSEATPYYISGLTKHRLINPLAKGYRTVSGYLGNPFADDGSIRYYNGSEDEEFEIPADNTLINGTDGGEIPLSNTQIPTL